MSNDFPTASVEMISNARAAGVVFWYFQLTARMCGIAQRVAINHTVARDNNTKKNWNVGSS